MLIRFIIHQLTHVYRKPTRWNRPAVATLSSQQPNGPNRSCSICSFLCVSELDRDVKVKNTFHPPRFLQDFRSANLLGNFCLDAPRVRQSDISFALTVVLHALSPPSAQQQTRVAAAKNISSSGAGTGGPVGGAAGGGVGGVGGVGGGGGSGDGSRGGSLSVHSGGGTHPQQQRSGTNNRATLLQVAFLGMKVLMTCFNHQLSLDWPRVARCIRDIGERRGDERNSAFWNFLIFVATQRGPLFPLILPLMWNKVLPKLSPS